MKRRITLLLAILLLIIPTVTACVDNKNPENRKDQWELSDEGGRRSEPDDLPDDMDLDGYKFQIFYRAGDYIKLYECDGDDVESESLNSVYQSVWERNERVKVRLNCDMQWIPSSNGGLEDTKSEINSILNKGEYYDVILSTNNTHLALAKNNYLCELTNAAYLDFSKPWWWEDVMTELSYNGDDIHFLVGDMNLVNITKMSAFYFNYRLLERKLNMQPEDLYQLVDDKEWTIEKLRIFAADCYEDTSYSPGVKDQNDIFAFPWVGGETVNQFVFSTRILDQLYTRNTNGTVKIDWAKNQDMEDLVSELTKLIYNTDGVWDRTAKNGEASSFDSGIIKEFSEGNYVFLPQRLTAATSDYMRAMRDDYGIIPYPTLSAGDEYVSYIQESSTSMCVPGVVRQKSEDNLDRVCMFLEAICAESYRYVTETFYEAALKGKYSRDDNAARMIDIIYDTAQKGFLNEYNSVAGITGIFYSAITNKKTLSSYIQANQEAAQEKINEYIKGLMRESHVDK